LLNAANSWIALANQVERDLARQKPEGAREQRGSARGRR
jgi:hypothetical protein